MLNSLFSAEITDYVGLRYASVSVSAAKADEKVLNELDKFLTKAEVTDKQLKEEILTDFIATLTGNDIVNNSWQISSKGLKDYAALFRAS